MTDLFVPIVLGLVGSLTLWKAVLGANALRARQGRRLRASEVQERRASADASRQNIGRTTSFLGRRRRSREKTTAQADAAARGLRRPGTWFRRREHTGSPAQTA